MRPQSNPPPLPGSRRRDAFDAIQDIFRTAIGQYRRKSLVHCPPMRKIQFVANSWVQLRKNMQLSTPSERQKVGMLIPPPVLLLALATIASLTQSLLLGWPAISVPRMLSGAAIVTASLFLVAVCGRQFRAAGTPARPTSPATKIVTTGPYSLSRNPMYLGMAGLLVGIALSAGSFPFAIAAIVFVATSHFGVILPEERYLQASFGSEYTRYKARVRRWL